LLCCHGIFVSTLRVSKAHWIGDLPSQYKGKLPELSNDTSFDPGVLLVIEMWPFKFKIRFCLVVLSWYICFDLESLQSPLNWWFALTT
jgi:hypothetical protein